MHSKDLLEIRKRIKARKPEFIRQDFHKKSGLKKKWRRPKGLHSKIRLNIRGKGKSVSSGYRAPKKIRGIHNSGMVIELVSSPKDLTRLDSKKHCLIISSSVGIKKRVIILKKTIDLGFNVLNIKSPNDYIKKIEERMSEKKKKEEKKSFKVKKDKKEEKLSDKLSNEEDKKIEKKEKDKVLTKRER